MGILGEMPPLFLSFSGMATMSNKLSPAACELASAEPWEQLGVLKRSSTGAKQVKRRQTEAPRKENLGA